MCLFIFLLVFVILIFIDFLRSRIPYRSLANIYNENLDSFLSGWMDNKIRALIFENREKPRLRYLLAAWHYSDSVVFGFVQVLIQKLLITLFFT